MTKHSFHKLYKTYLKIKINHTVLITNKPSNSSNNHRLTNKPSYSSKNHRLNKQTIIFFKQPQIKQTNQFFKQPLIKQTNHHIPQSHRLNKQTIKFFKQPQILNKQTIFLKENLNKQPSFLQTTIF